jgi:hypothetical protein
MMEEISSALRVAAVGDRTQGWLEGKKLTTKLCSMERRESMRVRELSTMWIL